MKRNKYIMLGVVLLVTLTMARNTEGGITAVFKQEEPMPTETGAKAGLLAPPFSLTGLDGKTYSVGGTKEKATFVSFWASWCDPCKQEAPELNKLAEKYKDKMDLYGVNVTSYDKLKDAKAFVDQYKLTFPIPLDEKGTVYAMYNGMAFPTNVLIDSRGVIQEIVLGIMPEKELEKKIKKLIAN
ncbi:TlpA disulfide reductase family protein [Paenibacillus silvae]|uniref:TlpA disulfide reductase family protein n=1 Tax=Paenibacillus silvae TaxID=1325358 RepID=UPI002005F28A|nr:TlpA disulfide reductase family protein [Paenibacillus silvae]MCK6074223.1 TlpA family protein disulfide reductase [Paenibacillus silvae]MCK6148299.1 TlpA family protein disulfide reductase [Paenibacillus silvae]MCK6266599.1 TlpA family protein disulfide reductase [Paenibacillus silvae]